MPFTRRCRVRHKAVAPNLDSLFAAPFGHQFQVRGVVAVAEERLPPAVAALCYVVRHPRDYYSCQPRHAKKLPNSTRGVKN